MAENFWNNSAVSNKSKTVHRYSIYVIQTLHISEVEIRVFIHSCLIKYVFVNWINLHSAGFDIRRYESSGDIDIQTLQSTQILWSEIISVS